MKVRSEKIDGLTMVCTNGRLGVARYLFGDPTRIVRLLTGSYFLPVTEYGTPFVVNTVLGRPMRFRAMNIVSTSTFSNTPPLPVLQMTRATIDGRVIRDTIPVGSLQRNTQFQKSFVTVRNECGFWEIGPQSGLDIFVVPRVQVTIVLYDFEPSYFCF